MYYVCYCFNVGASKGCISFTESPLSRLVPGSGVGRGGNWKHTGKMTRESCRRSWGLATPPGLELLALSEVCGKTRLTVLLLKKQKDHRLLLSWWETCRKSDTLLLKCMILQTEKFPFLFGFGFFSFPLKSWC